MSNNKKRIVLSDSSLNCYGYRVLTEGIELDGFRKNPVMLYMHARDEAAYGCMAIGHWEDVRVEGDVLSAVPVFDCVDEVSAAVAAKWEAETFNAASIGIRVIETSEDGQHLLPGQTRATVTRCRLMEASIVDIPANANAVRLYSRSDMEILAALPNGDCNVPELTPNKEVYMNLKATWKNVLAFLGVSEEQAEQTVLSAEQMETLNAGMARLQQENEALQASLAEATAARTAADAEAALLQQENERLVQEMEAMTRRVENLQQQPAEASATLAPTTEPAAQTAPEGFAAWLSGADGRDYAAVVQRMKEEGLI